MAVLARRDPLAEFRERILLWREGGPAIFAVEALGVPDKWDENTRTGVLDWQWEASVKLVKKRRLSIRSGHGVGKSAFLSWTILWGLTCFFPCKIPCTAPTSHQLSDVLWAELARWWRVYRERIPALGQQFEWTTDEFRLKEAPKESFAAARTARAEKPEALQGFHTHNGALLVLCDEASGIPDKIFEAGQGSLSQEGAFVVLTSNPTRLSGFFFDTQHKLRERWATMAVNGEDCPLVGKQFREDIAHQYGRTSSVYAVRVRGDFPNTEEDAVIPLSLLEDAAIREVEPYGDIIWGVDVARFGVDRTVLIKRCSNATLEPHKAWGGNDTMQTAGRIYAEWIETPKHLQPRTILVDVIGVGAGVCDRLGEIGLPVAGVNVAEEASVSERYVRLRDELWFNTREWLQKRHCALYKDETLIAELSLPKYTFTSNGKIKVESKDDMKKRYPQSPDCFVEGTLIDTPSGEISIEKLSAGMLVSTPMGPRKIIRVFESSARSITKVVFSNGRILRGKGKHKVFTWDAGFVRLDSLSLTNVVESNRDKGRLKWRIPSLLFTKTSVMSFKEVVSTIPSHTRVRMKDFYIAGFGQMKMVQFLMGMWFTIKMAIGQITKFQISKLCPIAYTQGCISQSDRKHLCSRQHKKEVWRRRESMLPNGMDRQKELLGTKGTDCVCGNCANGWCVPASSAGNNSNLCGAIQSTVQNHARIDTHFAAIKRWLGNVFSVALNFVSTSTGRRPVVPVRVQTFIVEEWKEDVKTFNLTLERDNVYYANSILVENCADALVLTFANQAITRGPSHYEPEHHEDY